MDVSKLPKLSTTSSDPNAAPNMPPPTPVQAVAQGQGHPATVRDHGQSPLAPNLAAGWVSIAVGIILMLMSPRIFEYLFRRSTFSWTFNDAQGNPLGYRQTVFFWGDVALAAFALVLIVDGIILGFLPRQRALLWVGLLLTAVATLLNLGYVVYMMSDYGFQIMSGLAVAFGGYIAFSQWQQLMVTRSSVVLASDH